MSEFEPLNLLTKKWMDGLSEAEAVWLANWLNASSANRVLASDWERIWNAVGQLPAKPVQNLDLDLEFSLLQQRLHGDSVPTCGKTVGFPRTYIWRAAAVFIVLLSAIYFFFPTEKPASQIETFANVAVLPVTLPDGSQVWLRQGGKLEYPEMFEKETREVRLDGEAYFDVQHRSGLPFKILTTHGDRIEVLGTSFGIRSNSSESNVFVRSGRVRFIPAGQNKQQLELAATEQAFFNRSQARVRLVKDSNLNQLAWHSGALQFKGTPLSQVVADLGIFYGVSITLENKKLENCPFTATKIDQPIDSVLNTLAAVFHFKINKDKNGIVVLKGGECIQH